MPLQNEQYDRILREYDQRQQENHRILVEKKEAVYAKHPIIKEFDDEIASNSAKATRLLLNGDEHALEELQSANRELQENKQELLKSYGYPPDYLTLTYTCPDCKDTGYITDKRWDDGRDILFSRDKCHCFKQAIIENLYQQSNIHSALEQDSFASLSYDFYDRNVIDERTGKSAEETMRNVISHCQDFIQSFDRDFRNILFYGPAGSGKTFLSNCIAKELLESCHTVIYLTAFELFTILEKHTFQKTKDVAVEEQFEGILTCDLLIIDDLGTELDNAFTTSQLYVCINERLLTERSTIISTNLSIDELSLKYGERISSRVVSSYQTLKLFTGKDIRIEKNL